MTDLVPASCAIAMGLLGLDLTLPASPHAQEASLAALDVHQSEKVSVAAHDVQQLEEALALAAAPGPAAPIRPSPSDDIPAVQQQAVHAAEPTVVQADEQPVGIQALQQEAASPAGPAEAPAKGQSESSIALQQAPAPETKAQVDTQEEPGSEAESSAAAEDSIAKDDKRVEVEDKPAPAVGLDLTLLGSPNAQEVSVAAHEPAASFQAEAVTSSPVKAPSSPQSLMEGDSPVTPMEEPSPTRAPTTDVPPAIDCASQRVTPVTPDSTPPELTDTAPAQATLSLHHQLHLATVTSNDDVDTGGFAELDAMDEFGLADLDLDDDWDPVHGNHDSSGHHDRSAVTEDLSPQRHNLQMTSSGHQTQGLAAPEAASAAASEAALYGHACAVQMSDPSQTRPGQLPDDDSYLASATVAGFGQHKGAGDSGFGQHNGAGDSGSGQLSNSPRGDAPPELFRQSPYDLAVSGQFRQSPHNPAVSGQVRQSPHDPAVSGQFRQSLHDTAVSEQFRPSSYDPAVSGHFRQSPPAWDSVPDVHRSTVQMQTGFEDRSQQHDQDVSHGQAHDRSSHDQLHNNGDQTEISPDEAYCPIVFGLESEEEERSEGAEPPMAEDICLPEHADVDMMSEDHEVEEWSAPGQDLAPLMVTHQPDVKKRSRIRDELFQGLMKRALEQTGERNGGLQPLVAQLSEAINKTHMLPRSRQSLGAEAPNTLVSLMEACLAMQSASSTSASTQKYFLALLILAQKTNSSSYNISPAGDPVHVTRQSDAAQPRHITLQRHTAVKSADDPLTAEMLEVVLSGR
ncbi:hypothetical protein WJX82_009876 [Trebouxia sp. C0006]